MSTAPATLGPPAPPHRRLVATAAAVLVLLLAVVDAGGWLGGRDDGAAGTLPVAAFQHELDVLAEDRAAAPGAAAAVLSSDGSWTGAAGLADLGARRPLGADDRFRIASITKTYVAAVVLQLVHEGALRLDERVAPRLPGMLPADKQSITVRHLLNHSSGLYDSMNDAPRELADDAKVFLASLGDPSLRRRVAATIAAVQRDPTTRVAPSLWVEIAMARPLDFAPGNGNRYSNTNYVVLGDLVERVTGRPLGAVLATRLLEPLGLEDTFYVPGPDLPPPFARGYVLGAGSPEEATRVTGGIAGASSVVADADDVARFYRALLNGRVLPARLLGTMLVERMGIGAVPVSCGTAYGHDGGWYGYASYARASRDGRHVAVLLLNGRGPGTDLRGGGAVDALFCGRGAEPGR